MNPNSCNCTLICHHKLCTTQDIILHGVIMAGNCYIHALITPNLHFNHSSANSCNSKEYTVNNDYDVAKSCKVTTIQAALDYQRDSFCYAC